ncbi:lysophospholipid acyltransferase family protein [Pedobacter punctiformis]|uniref:Lysophospholipid acyltransferase family protein n=1 Tax=Pedobacter punctiformis TaxID=3004097 RepID=A0ABT4L848_9SPHI|nr:lysophospholipid acyltransferase family protein [Pedobacter sp. HCMS5-2]MCZ4242969.1 lysophospholipid acyltransferase family protein [Pedobacter sp. HCMS5-2]
MIKKGFSHLGIFFLSILSLLPLSVLYIVADVVYVLLYPLFGYRKKVVRENLVKSFPEKPLPEILAIEKQYYKYLSNLILEVIKMTSISKVELQKRYKFNGLEKLEEYFKENKGVLICSAHYGNWEWGTLAFGLAISANHYPIYKPLTNSTFDKWFIKVRSRFGNKMVPMRQTLRAVGETKNEASVFSFGNDQSPTVNDLHYWTTFLNQPASIQLGIEKIAKKTNRPVFYLKVKVLKRGYYEVDCIPLCLEPVKTAEFEITELHTRILEDNIKESPAFWLWSHRRWKHKPKQELNYVENQYLKQA